MRLTIIRHGHAENRDTWTGSDLLRPLTERGRQYAASAFARYFSRMPHPSVIITSEAVRAEQTARILADTVARTPRIDPRLNPGASVRDILGVLAGHAHDAEVAIVGHEPDLSLFIEHYADTGDLDVVLKKGSLCRIENGMLINLVPQKLLRDRPDTAP